MSEDTARAELAFCARSSHAIAIAGAARDACSPDNLGSGAPRDPRPLWSKSGRRGEVSGLGGGRQPAAEAPRRVEIALGQDAECRHPDSAVSWDPERGSDRPRQARCPRRAERADSPRTCAASQRSPCSRRPLPHPRGITGLAELDILEHLASVLGLSARSARATTDP
jgi:hypothetical protein